MNSPLAERLQSAVNQCRIAEHWLTVDQARINAFADATDDHQFIHVDPERAAATAFGGTIAHGYLTLSLLPTFAYRAFSDLLGNATLVNYGINKLRLTAAVKVNSRIRPHMTLTDIAAKGTGTLLTFSVAMEIEGESKPAFTAEQLMLLI